MFLRSRLTETVQGPLGQQALITGGSRGLGLEVARQLARRGCDVVIVAKDLDRLKVAQEQLEAERVNATQRLSYVPTDMAALDGPARAAAEVLALLPQLDLIIQCAGVSLPARAREESGADLAETLGVNLTGPIRLTRALLPHLHEQGRGHISFVSSILGTMGAYGYASYCATKFGILGYALALEQELRPLGISVSVFCPVKIETQLLYDGERRMPSETRRVVGGTKPISVRQAAQVYLEGIASGQLLIYPDLASLALTTATRLSPTLVQHILARVIRR